MDNNAVVIVLTCGYCGFHQWEPVGDGTFKCKVCRERTYPEVMIAKAMKIKNRKKGE